MKKTAQFFLKTASKIEILARPKIENTVIEQLKIKNSQLENALLAQKSTQSSFSSSTASSSSDSDRPNVSDVATQFSFNRLLRVSIQRVYPGRPIEIFSFYEKI
jgi:hypothetical protein